MPINTPRDAKELAGSLREPRRIVCSYTAGPTTLPVVAKAGDTRSIGKHKNVYQNL